MRKTNPCLGATRVPCVIPEDHYALTLPFTPSNAQLTRYAEHFGHDLVIDRRKDPPGPTFDEKALEKLRAKYPEDPVYAALGSYREIEKAKATYVDGVFVHPDGRVRCTYGHKPLTLRLSAKDPNLTNQPRQGESPVYDKIKEMYVAPEGHTLCANDFGGIEAVIVHYLAASYDMDGARQGVRLALNDIHSFFTSHVVGEPADLSWSDDNLTEFLADIKKRYKAQRTPCKTTIHSSHYLTTPFKMHREQPVLFPDVKTARYYQDFYFDLFPYLKKWQWGVCVEADQKGYVTCPDGFRMHYGAAMMWAWNKEKGKWEQDYGPQAKEAVAAVPQHMGMSYLARAANTLFHDRFEEVGQYMRLLIHDEIFLETPTELCDNVLAVSGDVMRTPHPDMPLPPSWNMGSHLSINTEGKRGSVWAWMK